MKKYIFFIFIPVILLSCITPPKQPEITPEYKENYFILPVVNKVFFYRDGTTVYDAHVSSDGIIKNAFILPINIDRNSFSIHNKGKRIFTYSIEEAMVDIKIGDIDPRRPDRPLIERSRVLVINVPELESDSSLDVRFGIGRSGLTWELILDIEVKEGNTLDCNLLASIVAGSSLERNLELILTQKPEIILISSRNVFIEGSDAIFNLGNILVEKNKTTMIKLEEGQSSYRLVYIWNANTQEYPSAILSCTNPFNSSINNARGHLNSNGLNINRYNLALTPGRDFRLHVGEQPLLRGNKSVRTEEVANRLPLPFTHHLEYTITSQLSETVELEISVPLTLGSVHRTQYHFTRAPDERPGDQMVWKYRLAPGDVARVDFRFDSDLKDNPLYSHFNYRDGGR